MKFMFESGFCQIFNKIEKEKILGVRLIFLKNVFDLRMNLDEFDNNGK
jgi:hypothetical protein